MTHPWNRPSLEALEPRRLLAADPADLMANGFVPVEWQGQTVYAKPDQWVAKLDGLRGKGREQVAAVNAALDRAAVADLKAVKHLGQDGLVLMKSANGKKLHDVKGALDGANGLKAIVVEPDFALWAEATTPNDTFYAGYQYGLNNTGQTGGTPDADIDAPEAWDTTTGNGGVVVGVIDSGIDHSHPDLTSNMWRNPGEVAGNGFDDDGNGYTDDVFGWDFYNNDANPMDDNGHGTHVAGTIAAAGNNGTGVTGVAWNAKVMALKFLGGDGSGSLSGALAAINYTTDMRQTYGVNVRVTNNSWGGGGFSSTLRDAINKSAQAGILFVAAAGNGGTDGVGDDNDKYPQYPADYAVDNVISVAATDHSDRLAGFSNFGASSVDLAAPGVDIASTSPGNGYVYMSGTSMATPHVSGVAALAWSYNPAASYQTVRSAILSGVDPVSGLSGKTATGGRLNAQKALSRMPTPLKEPTAPSSLAAAAVSSSRIDLNWADNSGNEDGFKIERSTDGVNFTQIATVGAGVVSYADTGRAVGTTYTYRVRASNAAGDSAYSNTASATTTDTVAPSAPTNLSVTGSTANSVSLKWTASSDDVAVSGYRVLRDGLQIGTTTSASYSDTGLNTTTTYAYTVAAYDAAGNVSVASNSATATTQGEAATAVNLALGKSAAQSSTGFGGDAARAVDGNTDGNYWNGSVTATWDDPQAWWQVDLGSAANISGIELWNRTEESHRLQDFYILVSDTPFASNSLSETLAQPGVSAYHVSDIPLPSVTVPVNATGRYVRVQLAGTNHLSLAEVKVMGETSSTAADAQAPTAPTHLSVTTTTSSSISLSWTASTDDIAVAGYQVLRDGVQVGTTTETSYTDTGLNATTAYAYTVKAYDKAGNVSAASNSASGTTQQAIPIAPSGLMAAAVSSSRIDLNWADNSSNEDGFRVYLSSDGGATYSAIGTVGPGVGAVGVTGLSAGTTYHYRIRAYNAAGESGDSNVASATTLAAATTPGAPSGLAAAAVSAGEVDLTWADNSADESGFKIERKTGSTGTWSEAAAVGAGVSSWQDTGLNASTTYFYRVRAYNSAGDSAYSSEASATTAAALALAHTMDIGNVAAAGSASYDPATAVYSLSGSGADIGGRSDEFRFAYTTLAGDGEIVARVESLQGSDSLAKAGVMIRESLAANSKNALLAVTPGNGAIFQNRSSTGGKTSSTNISGLVAPHWVKLVRATNTITGYHSVDGVTWSKVGSTTVSMGSTVYVGVAVTSRADGSLATARFGNVSIAGAAAASAAHSLQSGPKTGWIAGSQPSPFSAVPIVPDAASVEDSDKDDEWDAPLLELLV